MATVYKVLNTYYLSKSYAEKKAYEYCALVSEVEATLIFTIVETDPQTMMVCQVNTFSKWEDAVNFKTNYTTKSIHVSMLDIEGYLDITD